jgi:hypothetical protein
MTLKNIIIKNINSKIYDLTPTKINWIESYLNSCPTSLNDIIKNISIIINNNKIEIYNIPKIILIIYNIYKDNIIKYDIENIDDITIFIKITIYSILDSNIFIIPNNERNIIDIVIDSSLDILKINTNEINQELTCCF